MGAFGSHPQVPASKGQGESSGQPMVDVLIAAKWREATDICGFELKPLGAAQLLPFTPGSHIDVEIAPRVIRQYSLCPARDAGCYRIAVLREPASRGGSLALCDSVGVGDRLRISRPKNHFPLAGTSAGSLLLAGGIGITPILCMAEHLATTGQKFALHYAARSRDRMAFRAYLEASAYADRVALHIDDGPIEQRLDLERVLAAPDPGAHLYVCGPAGLIDASLATAARLGWQDHQVHREYFAASNDLATGAAFTVRLASSGMEVEIPAGRTVADVLAAHGVQIDVSCKQGVCGTCLTQVLEGIPDHRDQFLTAEERAKNDQFTPCCSRSLTPVLTLDL